MLFFQLKNVKWPMCDMVPEQANTDQNSVLSHAVKLGATRSPGQIAVKQGRPIERLSGQKPHLLSEMDKR